MDKVLPLLHFGCGELLLPRSRPSHPRQSRANVVYVSRRRPGYAREAGGRTGGREAVSFHTGRRFGIRAAVSVGTGCATAREPSERPGPAAWRTRAHRHRHGAGIDGTDG
ncbi:hypothetical protein VFPFJ_10247 [Purpureocillium lilacinum]|uniref:Uncharacterized protein n=1 Tax=Purpureocillium lilacinum TaxID=33203 RepID=A0A179GKF6_PURLI|nr:hypothetical protein VFPFJ_10247 [Purpureocillium lilacinum]OAQ77880.1 hypothetical protein VFPFJ_10247 [Purpureocillium lilacinum]